MPCCSDGWEWWGGTSTPPAPHTPTHTHRLISGTTVLEAYTSIPVLPPTHPSSRYHYSPLWNHFTCVLSLSWGVNRSRWDRMGDAEEEQSEEVTTAPVHSRLNSGGRTGSSSRCLQETNVSRGDSRVSCGEKKIKLVENLQRNLLAFPSKHGVIDSQVEERLDTEAGSSNGSFYRFHKIGSTSQLLLISSSTETD